MKIDKLVLCEPANTVVSLTRGGLGFWSMETGALDCRIADTQGGKYRLDHLYSLLSILPCFPLLPPLSLSASFAAS